MKIEHETFDFHGGFYLPLPARRDSRRYDEAFSKQLLGGRKRSEAQGLPVPDISREGTWILIMEAK